MKHMEKRHLHKIFELCSDLRFLIYMRYKYGRFAHMGPSFSYFAMAMVVADGRNI